MEGRSEITPSLKKCMGHAPDSDNQHADHLKPIFCCSHKSSQLRLCLFVRLMLMLAQCCR